jgi:hypothetical protein
MTKSEKKWFILRGRSMHPTLPEGTPLEVEPAKPDQIEPGELIAFRRNGKVIVHRLLDKFRLGQNWILMERPDAGRKTTLVRSHELIGRARVPSRVMRHEQETKDILHFTPYAARFTHIAFRILYTLFPRRRPLWLRRVAGRLLASL